MSSSKLSSAPLCLECVSNSETTCTRHAIGLTTSDQQYLWTLRDVRAVDELDVSILQKLVFERLMGLTQDSIDRQENLRY